MKAVVELTREEYNEQTKVLNVLRDITLLKNIRPFSELIRCTGYAHYTFNCTVSPEFIKALGRTPTPDEVIMLVDGGFNHFGATCRALSDGVSFDGRVNTD